MCFIRTNMVLLFLAFYVVYGSTIICLYHPGKMMQIALQWMTKSFSYQTELSQAVPVSLEAFLCSYSRSAITFISIHFWLGLLKIGSIPCWLLSSKISLNPPENRYSCTHCQSDMQPGRLQCPDSGNEEWIVVHSHFQESIPFLRPC